MTNTKELPVNIETWVTALESGEYDQSIGSLYDGEGYCCLGVYAKVVLGYADEDILSSSSGTDSAGPNDVYDKIQGDTSLVHGVYQEGITMNDSGKSFTDIAKMIREAYT
jgi:hypothetical protein